MLMVSEERFMVTSFLVVGQQFTRLKSIERCRDRRSEKQGMDDSIKQFSTQLHPKYLSTSTFVGSTALRKGPRRF